MTYSRVVSRNGLHGDYVDAVDGKPNEKGLIAGDLRRLEKDQRDLAHLAAYAKKAGISKREVLIVLDEFFKGFF